MPIAATCVRSSCGTASVTRRRRRGRSDRRSSSVPRRPPSWSVSTGRRSTSAAGRSPGSMPTPTRRGRPACTSDSAGTSGRRATGSRQPPRSRRRIGSIPIRPPSAARARILAHLAGLLHVGGPLRRVDPDRRGGPRRRPCGRLAGGPGAGPRGPRQRTSRCSGGSTTGIERFREGVAIAEELGGVEGIALGATNLAILLDRVGRTAEALEVATAGWERARATRRRTDLRRAAARHRREGRDRTRALGRGGDIPRRRAGARPDRDTRDPIADPARAARHDARRSRASRGGPGRGRAQPTRRLGGTEDRAAILAALAELAAVDRRDVRVPREAVEEGLRTGHGRAARSRVGATGRDRRSASKPMPPTGHAPRATTPRSPSHGAARRAILVQVERIAAVLGVPRRGSEAVAATVPSRDIAVSRPVPGGGRPARGGRRRVQLDRRRGHIRGDRAAVSGRLRSIPRRCRDPPRPRFARRRRSRPVGRARDRRAARRPAAGRRRSGPLARHARLDLAGTDGDPDRGSGDGARRRTARPDRARGGGPRPHRRGLVEPGDRRRAVHQPQDRQRPRVAHLRQARRREPRRSRRDRAPPGARRRRTAATRLECPRSASRPRRLPFSASSALPAVREAVRRGCRNGGRSRGRRCRSRPPRGVRGSGWRGRAVHERS